MSKRITAVALAVLMLSLALPATATIQATSVEIRGAVASNNPTSGQMPEASASWNPNNFAGFYYDLKNDIGTENLTITCLTDSRTISQDCLWYNTTGQPKTLYAVLNNHTSGLLQFTDNGFGNYTVEGWQAQAYVALKGHTDKLAKLVLEQGNATSEKKTLAVGDTWDIGNGWQLQANSIDAKATPRQAWFSLSKDGVKKDDAVVQQGQVYTYVEKNIGGESDVPLFVTYVDSVFSGATSDVVQLRYTWAIDTSITQVKGGDTFGVFKISSATTGIQARNDDSSVSLSKDTTINLMGEMNFRTADSDTVRFYPMVQYQIGPGVGPTTTGTGPAVTTPPANVTTPPANVTTPPPTEVPTTVVTTAMTGPVTTTPKTPGFEAGLAIAGLLAVAYLVLRQRK